MMNISRSDCVPINFTNRLVYTPSDLESAKELLHLSYPSRDNTFGIWGNLSTGWLVAFYIHVCIFGVAYFVLGSTSLLVLMKRDFQSRKVLRRMDRKIVVTLTCINVLLIILGYSKFLFFVLDPYQISNYLNCQFCHIPWNLLESLTLPSITIAFTLEFFTLWLCIRIIRESVFDKCKFVVPLTFFNYAIVITVQVIANLDVPSGIVSIIACNVYFICFGVVVCFAYVLTAWRVIKVIKVTVRRVTLLTATFEAQKQPDNKTTTKDDKTTAKDVKDKRPHFNCQYSQTQQRAIRKIYKICYGTAILGLLLSVIQIVLLVILSKVVLTDCISSAYADRNLWLVFIYLKEIIMLAMGFVLLYCTASFTKLLRWMKLPCCVKPDHTSNTTHNPTLPIKDNGTIN